MSSVVTHWDITGADGQTIFGDTHRPAGRSKGHLLVMHGFKGYKDYGFLPRLADAAASQGWLAHRFNFSHSGMTRAIDRFERPDLFERETWRFQVEDVQHVLRHVTRHEHSSLPVVLFGHSRGGLTSILAAREIQQRGGGLHVDGVVAAAAPADANRLNADDRNTLLTEGRLLSPSGRTGQDLFVGKQWLEQIDAEPRWHDPLAAAAELICPLLIVHGTGDTTVDIADAHRYADAQPNAHLVKIAGANHVFDALNPLPVDADFPASTRELFGAVISFTQRLA